MTPSDFTTFFRNENKHTKIQKSQKLNGILMRKRTFKNEKCAWKNEKKTDTLWWKIKIKKKIATQLFTAFVKSFWCSENSIIIIEKNKKWNKILPQPPAPHHITKNDIRYSDLHRALVNVVIMYLWNFLQKGLVFVFKQCVQD